MKLIQGMFLGSLVFMMGCAHGTMRGTVAMKVADDEAHICANKGELTVGDQVRIFTNRCQNPKANLASNGAACEKVELGRGEVTRLLNEHYSVVKAQSGVKFEEGSFVEKI